MATDCSVAVEFDEADSDGNRGHSRSDKGYRSLPRDLEKDAVSTVAS